MNKEIKYNVTQEDGKKLNGWADVTKPMYGLYKEKPNTFILGEHDGTIINDSRGSHIYISASTGGNKVSGPIGMSLIDWRESAIVNDIKGDVFEITAGKRAEFSDIHVFDPFDENSQTSINILLEARTGVDSLSDVTIIAQSLISEHSHGYSPKIVDNAGGLLTTVLLYILHCETLENKNFGFAHDFISRDVWDEGFNKTMAEATLPEAKEGQSQRDVEDLQKYIREGAKRCHDFKRNEMDEIISLMLKSVVIYKDAKVMKNSTNPNFSIKNLFWSDRPQTLYLRSSDTEKANPIFKLIYEMMFRTSFNEEPRKLPNQYTGENAYFNGWPKLKDRNNVLCIVDEAPSFGKMSAFDNGIAFARSFGVRVVMVAQSLSMLESVYGDSHFSNNFDVKLFLSQIMNENIEDIRRCKNKDEENGVRETLKDEELREVSDSGMAILTVNLNPPFKINKTNYFKHSAFNDAAKIKYNMGTMKKETIKTDWDNISNK